MEAAAVERVCMATALEFDALMDRVQEELGDEILGEEREEAARVWKRDGRTVAAALEAEGTVAVTWGLPGASASCEHLPMDAASAIADLIRKGLEGG